MVRSLFIPSRQVAVAAALVVAWCTLTVPLHADRLPEFSDNPETGIRRLLELAGPRQVYLVGDATHGSSEFYRFRQQISRELILRYGVRRVVLEVEADEAEIMDDWLNQQEDEELNADILLARAVHRWPSWVWANREVAEFLEWLRGHNLQAVDTDRVRLYGMDMKDRGGEISETYAALIDKDPYEAWNFRSRHMAQNVMQVTGNEYRTVVWAHNNHVGDKRADETPGVMLVSVGQLLRESLGSDHVFIIGSAASEGHYVAAPKWGEDWRVVSMAPALSGSVAHSLNMAGDPRSLIFWQKPEQGAESPSPVYHRGIGVISDEGRSNEGTYVLTRIQHRYDALVFFRRVGAVQPLR